MTYSDPATLLRDARRRHRVTQSSLARRAGTSARHIGRIERGEASPSVETLQRLLGCMGERLELGLTDGPADNRSDADVAEDLKLSPGERVAAASRLSRTLTAVAGAARG
jgi:transcriptional regulator with XRE-family HTH domain